jgi:hypothetical protein
MNRKTIAQTAAAILIAATSSAAADQFAIQTDGPVAGASNPLLATLHIREVAAVEINGAHFIVIDARDEGYVEAYVFAMNIDATSLYRLEEDWDGAGLSSLPMEARVPFLHATVCEFCIS